MTYMYCGRLPILINVLYVYVNLQEMSNMIAMQLGLDKSI